MRVQRKCQACALSLRNMQYACMLAYSVLSTTPTAHDANDDDNADADDDADVGMA